MNELQNFTNGIFNLDIKVDGENVLFSAEQVAKTLGITQMKNGKEYVKWERVNSYLPNSPEVGKGALISEPMVYKLAFKANNAVSEKFTDWLAIEVLPTIRKHGAYMTQPQVPTTQRELIMLALAGNEETNQRIDAIEEQVTDLKENATLNPGEYGYIGRRINQRVSEVAKGYGNITQEQRGKLYKDINQGVKAITGVSTRTQLRTKHYEVVLEFINDWEPSTATKMQVRQTSFEF